MCVCQKSICIFKKAGNYSINHGKLSSVTSHQSSCIIYHPGSIIQQISNSSRVPTSGSNESPQVAGLLQMETSAPCRIDFPPGGCGVVRLRSTQRLIKNVPVGKAQIWDCHSSLKTIEIKFAV